MTRQSLKRLTVFQKNLLPPSSLREMTRPVHNEAIGNKEQNKLRACF